MGGTRAEIPESRAPAEPPANGRLRIWCLRHAESENTVLGAVGALPRTPLTPTGRQQAVEAGRRLRNEPVARVYTSPAVRARETAETLATQLGQATAPPVVPLPGLAEVSLGSREGATNQATRSRLSQVLHAWLAGGDREPRVADGESGHQVVSRVTTALHQITVYHPPGACVVLVGHAVSLTAGLVDRCGLAAGVWSGALPHAVPFTVEWDGRAWHCPVWPTPN